MGDSIQLQPFGLDALPLRLREQFAAEVAKAHALLQGERDAFEDPGGRGRTLQDASGVLSVEIVLSVRIDMVVESGATSVVAGITAKPPKLKPQRQALISRGSGFYVEEEAEQDRLPLARPKLAR